MAASQHGPQHGEVWDSRQSQWCPYCHKTQMVVKGVKVVADKTTKLEWTTLMWKCPVWVEDFSEA
jgi:hypothetical protein